MSLKLEPEYISQSWQADDCHPCQTRKWLIHKLEWPFVLMSTERSWRHNNQGYGIDVGPPSLTSWRRKWQPTPAFLPGESHGRRSLAGYGPWGRKESDTTERLHSSLTSTVTNYTNQAQAQLTGSTTRGWQLFHIKKAWVLGDFPRGPVVTTLCFQSNRPGFDSWSGS